MALGATIYKATIDISDIDRGYYGTHLCTLARHPSETEERLAVRLLTYCLFVGEENMRLEFGRGLSTEGEPALWEIDDTGSVARWIEVGVPDVKQVRKSAGRSDEVIVVAYGEDRLEPWWQQNMSDFRKVAKLSVAKVLDHEVEHLTKLMTRTMHLSVTVQDGVVWLSDSVNTAQIQLHWLLRRE